MHSWMKTMSCCLFLVILAALSWNVTLAQTTEDNANVTALFARAKASLAKIKTDAREMEAYSEGLSWQSHAAKLTKIKDDVNELSGQIEGMKTQRRMASAWQQDAIDRISPLMADLVANMNATIDQLNKSKRRPNAPPYPEYLKANTRIATDLSNEINDAVDYAQAKATKERLSKELDKS